MRAFQTWCHLAAMLMLFPGVACREGGPIELDAVNETKAAEVRQLITDELEPGADSEAIEEFFKKNEITYSYNRFSSRYQAIIRDVATGPGVDQAVVIHVKVDDQRRFVSAEVRDSFTAP
jgi:hypothetical protein